MLQAIRGIFEDHIAVSHAVLHELAEPIQSVCQIMIESIRDGNKILLFGNGGSASDAQHIAAEFTGRFVKNRQSLPAIALTTDTSALTAIGNDYGFEAIFARQLEGLAKPGDVVIGISTSGNSPNVLKGLETAKKNGCKVIGLSGRDGGSMTALCDINLIIPSDSTARIQEMHILIGHIICSSIDDLY